MHWNIFGTAGFLGCTKLKLLTMVLGKGIENSQMMEWNGCAISVVPTKAVKGMEVS